MKAVWTLGMVAVALVAAGCSGSIASKADTATAVQRLVEACGAVTQDGGSEGRKAGDAWSVNGEFGGARLRFLTEAADKSPASYEITFLDYTHDKKNYFNGIVTFTGTAATNLTEFDGTIDTTDLKMSGGIDSSLQGTVSVVSKLDESTATWNESLSGSLVTDGGTFSFVDEKFAIPKAD